MGLGLGLRDLDDAAADSADDLGVGWTLCLGRSIGGGIDGSIGGSCIGVMPYRDFG